MHNIAELKEEKADKLIGINIIQSIIKNIQNMKLIFDHKDYHNDSGGQYSDCSHSDGWK